MLNQKFSATKSRQPYKNPALAIWHGCRTGKTTRTIALIKRFADFEMKNARGQTPMLVAAEYGQMEMVVELVSAGANFYATDNEGRGFIDYARKHGGHEIDDGNSASSMLMLAMSAAGGNDRFAVKHLQSASPYDNGNGTAKILKMRPQTASI